MFDCIMDTQWESVDAEQSDQKIIPGVLVGDGVGNKIKENYTDLVSTLEKAMVTHSSTLAWQIPWTEEPWQAAVHGVTRSQTRLSDFTFTFHFHALEKEMAPHSSVLAWRISGTGEPGGLLSMGHTGSDTTEATQQQQQ